MAQRYRIRSSKAGTKARPHTAYMITVPREIAENVPSGTEFAPELTDEGILFRPAGTEPEPDLPAWARAER